MTYVMNMRRQPFWLAVVLIGLLLVEYLLVNLALSTPFDMETARELPDFWHGLFLNANLFLQAVIGGLCLVALVFATGSRAGLHSLADILHAEASPKTRSGWGLLHLGTLIGFAITAYMALSHPGLAQRGGISLFAAWLGLGAVSVFSLGFWLMGRKAGLAVLRSVLPLAVVSFGLSAFILYLGSIAEAYWHEVSTPALILSTSILQLCCDGVDVDRATAIVQMDDFRVRIDPSCSGIQGMVFITVFLLGFLYVRRAEFAFPRAFLVIPAGIALSFLANSLRLAILILIGAKLSPTLAMEAFHSLAGWIFFCLIAISMVLLLPRIGWLRSSKVFAAPQASYASAEMTIVTLLPFAAWLATGLVVSAVSLGQDPLYPIKVLAGLLVLGLLARRLSATGVFRTGEPLPVFAALPPGPAATLPWLIGAIVFVLWLALSPPPVTGIAKSPLTGMPFLIAVIWVGCRIFGSVVLVPIMEELAFRGYLHRRLISADIASVPAAAFSWLSLIGSSVAFGALHGAWLAGILAGLGFSLALYLRGRLMDAVVAHGVANLLIAATVLLSGRWGLW